MLFDVKDENPHVKMREHLQVIAKECSKPIAKFIQVDTEVQKVYLARLRFAQPKLFVEAKPAALKLDTKDTIKPIRRWYDKIADDDDDDEKPN